MRDKKIFIACPITKYLDANTLISPEYEDFIKIIYKKCCAFSKNVFLALEREKYGKALMEGHECTLFDYREMIDSDIVIALPEDSMGVAVELGWASAMRKQIFLILDDRYTYSPLIESLDIISTVTILHVPSRESDPIAVISVIQDQLERYLQVRFTAHNFTSVGVR